MSELNKKQIMFCKEYLVDMNASQAAIRAGYSPKTAGSQAFDLLKKPEIQDFINQLTKEREKASEITSEWILQNLKELAERCMQKVPVKVREGKSLVQKKEFNEEGEEVGVWEFDSTGAARALELLGKYRKLFTEKVEHSGSIDTTINFVEK